MKTDLGYRERYLQIKEQISQIQTQKNPVNGIYQVPVVVHVMHKGESVGTGTNISDADVKLGIQYLNNFWRKVASSVGDGDGVDMQIEFTLAIQDEGGNCTDGIDRVDMSGVTEYVNNGVKRSSAGIADYNGDAAVNSLKEYSIWDPTEFYNVWLVDEIDNAKISEALQKSNLAQLVQDLPKGLDTILGENGIRLSGGQRQRISLARAFYHNRDVLIMDEATSALDNETEQEIVDEIRRLKKEKTIIIIAHRMSTLKDCDYIYRIDDGKIIEKGSYSEVVEKKL